VGVGQPVVLLVALTDALTGRAVRPTYWNGGPGKIGRETAKFRMPYFSVQFTRIEPS
jgi:hypothetical protein